MSRAEATTNSGGVQVIQRATKILHALVDEPNGLSLSQIAARVGLARSTVHRLVMALEEERLILSASPNGRFRLGPALAILGMSAQRDVAQQLRPFLAKLHREVDETVDLAVLDDDKVLFLDQIAAPHRLRAVSALGATFPAHCTANGKALLAALPDERVERLLPERLEALTPNTITDRDELLAHLATIRASGIAFDREEHTIGICAVGAAVSSAQLPSAAITVPLPAQRFHDKEKLLVERLREICIDIEHSLDHV